MPHSHSVQIRWEGPGAEWALFRGCRERQHPIVSKARNLGLASTPLLPDLHVRGYRALQVPTPAARRSALDRAHSHSCLLQVDPHTVANVGALVGD